MIILDSNVLIGFLDASDPQHLASLDLLERHFVDGFGSSVLTVAEALVHPSRAQRQDAAMESLAAIGLRIISLDASEATALADVRSSYRLRMPDAVALHAAMHSGSPLGTFDEALAAAATRAGVSRAT